MGTVKELLQQLGDADTGFTFTQIGTVSLPLSALYAPLISRFILRRGFGASYLVTESARACLFYSDLFSE